jgi:hypothetical protein
MPAGGSSRRGNNSWTSPTTTLAVRTRPPSIRSSHGLFALEWFVNGLLLLTLFGVVAIILDFSAVGSSTPTPVLSLSPTTGTSGTVVAVTGTGFGHTVVQLTWDGSPSGLPSVQANGNGTFHTKVVVPVDVTIGTHSVAATSVPTTSVSNKPTPRSASAAAIFTTVSALSVSTTTMATPAATATSTATPSPSPSPIPTATPSPSPTLSPSTPLFGTLLTDPSRATLEYAAGVRVTQLELGWDAYEPQDGVFSSTYASAAKQRLAAMRSAGMLVVLGVGLQYPPSWVYSYANSRYVDQYGVASGLNLTWNQTLRQKAAAYIARVLADLGPANFSAVRIGSGAFVETFYPDEWDGKNGNAYWAYDANGQAGSPYPGWKPGEKTYNGAPFTTTQVNEWYEWYIRSLVSGVNWQIALYRQLGFTGFVHLLMPGQGVRPSDYASAINGYLSGAGDASHTVGRGAAWHRVVELLTDRTKVVAYVSSLADGSGGNDLCQSTDSSVPISDTRVNNWSAARWVSYNANRFGMAKNGENPGPSDTNSYGKAMMQAMADQAVSCGMQGAFWAHDSNLYATGSGVSLSDYSAIIATQK